MQKFIQIKWLLAIIGCLVLAPLDAQEILFAHGTHNPAGCPNCDNCAVTELCVNNRCRDISTPPPPGSDCHISGGTSCADWKYPDCECISCDNPFTVRYDLQGGYGVIGNNNEFKCPSVENPWINDSTGCALYHRNGMDIWKPGHFLGGWYDEFNPRRAYNDGFWFMRHCLKPGLTVRTMLANWVKCEAGTFANQSTGSRCAYCPVGTYQDMPGQNECKPCADSSIGPGATKCSDYS
jgi:hypothetical protein